MATAPGSCSTWWRWERSAELVDALGVAFASIATAWNSRENGFVWDDRVAVLSNRDVNTAQSKWQDIFVHDFWGKPIDSATSHKSYRPLTTLSFRWDQYWHGFDPRAFHMTNVIAHALCATLVWRTAWVVLGKYERSKYKTSSPKQHLRHGALLAGLVFAVHPIHCDSVASIVGRADLLCVAFALSGFLAYDIAETQSSWTHFALAIALAVASSLCKELGFTVFGIYAAHDLLSGLATNDKQSTVSVSTTTRRLRLVYLALCLVGLAFVRLRVNGRHTQAVFNTLANSINSEPNRLVRIMSYAHIHAWYLYKLVWPSWFSYDYGFNTIPIIAHVFDPRNMATLAAYAVVATGIYKGVEDISTRNRPTLLLCIAFGLIPFVPASNVFFPVGTIVAERLLYFPSVGFSLLIGYVTNQVVAVFSRHDVQAADKRVPTTTATTTTTAAVPYIQKAVFSWTRKASPVLVALILATAFHLSRVRNAEWVNEQVLFTAAMEVVPDNVKVLNNVAKVLLHSDPKRALQASRRAIHLLPVQVEGQTNLALGYGSAGQTLLAILHFIKSFSYTTAESSGAGYAGNNLYRLWLDQHNESATAEMMIRSPTIKLALEFIDEAIRRRTTYPTHYYLRALISYRLHDFPTALIYAKHTQVVNDRIASGNMDSELLLSPGELVNLVGVIHRGLGDNDQALHEMLKGIEKYPNESDLYFNVAAIYISKQQFDAAEMHLENCLKVCSNAEEMGRGAEMLQKIGFPDAAKAFEKRAAELRSA